ncbi:MAG: protein-L-isoaspartate O-methyltransferase [Candidatus Thermoplasmatota archaeon]|nr:protein-L-isoaspartate O-methyltransferase [Candidatus Thermoplasmatota archaeon]MBU1941540.1 protein-L-isoaspartate O-methyltransferase [Candidatus Thermoplasmatota archaeon]
MFEEPQKRLVSHLKQNGYIKSLSVENAFIKIPRELFVPLDLKQSAYVDTPLQIGKGQTISAPHMVAIMSETLDLHTGLHVLEIGSGSGYHAAITASIVGEKGHVYTIERIETLAQMAKENISRAKIANVTVIIGDGSEGLPKYAPYDRIYITCAAPRTPPPLFDQLKNMGKLLVPEGDMICTLMLYEKHGKKFQKRNFGGCAFVPLLGKYGHQK